jgi:hypothetical protein
MHLAFVANEQTPGATPTWDSRHSAEPSPSPSYSPQKAKPEQFLIRPRRTALWARTEESMPRALPCRGASKQAAELQRKKKVWERPVTRQPPKGALERMAPQEAPWARAAPHLQSKPALEPQGERPKEPQVASEAAEIPTPRPRKEVPKPIPARPAFGWAWAGGLSSQSREDWTPAADRPYEEEGRCAQFPSWVQT